MLTEWTKYYIIISYDLTSNIFFRTTTSWSGLRRAWSGSRRRWSCWAAIGTRTTGWPSTSTRGRWSPSTRHVTESLRLFFVLLLFCYYCIVSFLFVINSLTNIGPRLILFLGAVKMGPSRKIIKILNIINIIKQRFVTQMWVLLYY